MNIKLLHFRNTHLISKRNMYFESAMQKDSKYINVILKLIGYSEQSSFVRILNIGTLFKDWLAIKMYFHRIFASSITSCVFAVLFNFIITAAIGCAPNIVHPIPVVALLYKCGPSLFSTINTTLKGFVSVNPGFSKTCWNLFSSRDGPRRLPETLPNQELSVLYGGPTLNYGG